jgi:transcriptional regulator GlxA family with amidase domain
MASNPFTLGFLLIDGFALMSYAAAVEPFRAANVLAAKKLYRIIHVSEQGGSAHSSSGALVPADFGFANCPDLDLLLVMAGGDPLAFDDHEVFHFLRQQAARGVALCGVSGGPVILARAGVMEGHRMTVHWEHAAPLLEAQQDLLLSRALYVFDRRRHTCAGGVAPLDMMHALIAEHQGASFARAVSDWFLHTEIRPPGRPQKAESRVRRVANAAVNQCVEIMQNHIGDPLTLGQLARLAGCSGRHLNRVFNDAYGRSVMACYRDMRLHESRRLLHQTALSVTEIAYATGFSSGAHYAQAFRAKFGQSPRSARRG